MESTQAGQGTTERAETWRDRRRARIAEWFAEHRATLTTYTGPGGASIECVRWARPGTRQSSVNYQSHGHRLIVTGDLGHAIYLVSQAQPIGFWATCDLSYFAGKCVASPNGPGYETWDATAAHDAIRDLLREFSRERQQRFGSSGGFGALKSAEAWRAWLERHGALISADVGGWEYGGIGDVPSQECEAHLTGLKLAMAQLRAQGVVS